MASPQLSRLKIRVDHLLLAVGGLILVVGGIWAWQSRRPDAEQTELDAKLERMGERHASQGSRAPRILRPYLKTSAAGGDDDPQLPLRPPANSEAVGPEEAIDDFRTIMAELEDALEDNRKLSRAEKAELYNRASGSFTAMSAWIDADDATERALMDDAYAQMRSLMRELDIEPPRHDPDHNPLRR